MNDKVFFRADGGGRIGLGHLIRCSALAEMIKEHYSISFFCIEIPEAIEADFSRAGFDVHQILSDDSFVENLTGTEIVVLDHYGLGADYQLKIKEKGCTLVCIDDFHKEEFFADLIVNHAPGLTRDDYIAQPYTEFALGLKYALLRPVFLKVENKRPPSQIRNVFVCFGGADPQNLTEQALAALMECNKIEKINVIVGKASTSQTKVQEMALNDERINVFSGITEYKMHDLMSSSDIAIVPASTVLIEAIASGMEVITCYYVDNQKYFHDQIIRKGIASIGLADSSFREKLKKAVDFYSPSGASLPLQDEIRNSSKNNLAKFNSLTYGKI